MQWLRPGFNFFGAILNDKFDSCALDDGGVPGSDGVDDVLVDCPEFVPLHEIGVLGGTLLKHEDLECFYSETTAHDALHGGEAGIHPGICNAFLDEPLEGALGEDGGDQI